MMFKTANLNRAAIIPLTAFALCLSGCGGSSSSGASDIPPVGTSATISKENGVQATVPSYQIVVSASGAVTYTTQIIGQQAQAGSGTVPGPLVAKFFQDLNAAEPLAKLPEYTGPFSSQTTFLSVQYGSQSATLAPSTDTKAQGLAADATAIAQALGLPANGLGG